MEDFHIDNASFSNIWGVPLFFLEEVGRGMLKLRLNIKIASKSRKGNKADSARRSLIDVPPLNAYRNISKYRKLCEGKYMYIFKT